jgi:hypothetical protein
VFIHLAFLELQTTEFAIWWKPWIGLDFVGVDDFRKERRNLLETHLKELIKLEIQKRKQFIK